MVHPLSQESMTRAEQVEAASGDDEDLEGAFDEHDFDAEMPDEKVGLANTEGK